MSEKRRIEVFTAGCPICQETVEQVKAAACPNCEIIVYDLNAGCETNECREKAAHYGIKVLPAVAIDGKLADCCSGRAVDIEVLKKAGLGQSLTT